MTDPAMELLFLSVSGCDHALARREAEELLGGGADPDRVLSLATGHSVWMLLDGFLSRHNLALPSEPASILKRMTDHTRGQCARQAAELRRILEMLGSEGVRPLVFKGPALSVLAYGRHDLRPAQDLDLLVKPEDLRRAKDILAADGFVWRNSVPASVEEAYIDGGWEYILHHPGRGARVDLASTIAPGHYSLNLDIRALWDDPQEVELSGGNSALAPGPRRLPLLLAVHGAKHVWERLLWIADIAGILRGAGAADVEAIDEAAARCGLRRIWQTAALLAGDLAGRSWEPAPVRADARARRLADGVWAAIGGGAREPASWRGTLQFHLASRERLRDRARHLWRAAATPSFSDLRRVHKLPGARVSARVLRPFRLAFDIANRRLNRRRRGFQA